MLFCWKDGKCGFMQLVSFLKRWFENVYCIFGLGTFIIIIKLFFFSTTCVAKIGPDVVLSNWRKFLSGTELTFQVGEDGLIFRMQWTGDLILKALCTNYKCPKTKYAINIFKNSVNVGKTKGVATKNEWWNLHWP